MRTEFIGPLLSLRNVASSLATHYRPTPLRSADIGGEYNFPAAQSSEEILARWTEIFFYDRSAAAPARVASYFGGLRSTAVLVNNVHCLFAIGHGPLFECSSALCNKSSGARAALLTSLIA
jgi:hypothetical protein